MRWFRTAASSHSAKQPTKDYHSSRHKLSCRNSSLHCISGGIPPKWLAFKAMIHKSNSPQSLNRTRSIPQGSFPALLNPFALWSGQTIYFPSDAPSADVHSVWRYTTIVLSFVSVGSRRPASTTSLQKKLWNDNSLYKKHRKEANENSVLAFGRCKGGMSKYFTRRAMSNVE